MVFIYRLIGSYTVVEMLNYICSVGFWFLSYLYYKSRYLKTFSTNSHIERKFTLNYFEIVSHMQPLFFVTLTIFSDVFTQTIKHLTCQLKLLARHLTESIGIIIIIIRHANIIKEKKNHMAAIAVFLNLMLHKTKIYLFLSCLDNHRPK